MGAGLRAITKVLFTRHLFDFYFAILIIKGKFLTDEGYYWALQEILSGCIIV